MISNVVSFQLESGDRWWYIVGCYLAPDDASTIEDIVAAISKRPWGAALLAVGDFNTNLATTEVLEQNKGIAAALAEEGLEDMISHFLPRHKLWLKDGHPWVIHWGGWEVRSQTNYILGIDSFLSQNVAVRDARHNTDHYLLLWCLC